MKALDELRIVLIQAQAAIQEGLRLVGESESKRPPTNEDEHD